MAQLLHVRVPLVSAASFSGAAAAGSPAAAGCCLRALAWRAALPAPMTASAAGGTGAARTCSSAPTESAGAAAAARGSAPALPAPGEAKAAGTFLQQKGPEAAITPASVPCRRNKDSRCLSLPRALQQRVSACAWLSPRSKRTGCSSSCDTALVSGTTGGGSGSVALRQEEKRLFPLSHQQQQKQEQLLGSRTGTSVPQWRGFSSASAAAAAAGGSYDVVVVGGGPGGYVAAIKAAQLGLRTACVEKRGALGGTCLNVGCIPSKAVLNISNKFAEAREHFSRYGIMGVTKESLSVDITKVQQQKQRIVKTLTQGIEFLFKKNQVHYIIGEGKLADPHTVAVTSSAGGAPTRLEAKNIILATGSEPSPLPGNCVPIDEKVILSSTGALEMPAVPRHLAVIGGGVIGLELGSVWRNFGAEVTVIEFLDRLLPPVDGEVAKAFHKEMQKIGINFQLGTKVVGADVRDDSATLHLEPAQGGERFELEADAVLLAVGRRPFTKDLGLEELGIEKDKAGRLIVDSSFGTRRFPHIKAIGDLIPGPMLAHKAEEEGIACVEMIAGRSSGHINYHTIPSVVYTHPEIAGVGKTEEELKKEGVNYAKGKFPFAANSRARCIDVADGFVKILTEKETDKILGAWIMGPEAGELVAQLVLALEYGASAEDLGRTCTAHPTLSEAVKEACMACYEKPIHVA